MTDDEEPFFGFPKKEKGIIIERSKVIDYFNYLARCLLIISDFV